MALYEHLEGRTTQVYSRPWSTSSINRRYQELPELLQVGLRLARPPDPPPPAEQQALQRHVVGTLRIAWRSGNTWHLYHRSPRCTL